MGRGQEEGLWLLWWRFDAGFESVIGAGLGLHVKVGLLRESMLQTSALE